MATVTGLNGNEIWCLDRKGLRANALVVGNSVQAIGIVGAIIARWQTFWGGEVGTVTQLIADGRNRALERMTAEATKAGSSGITGVSNELIWLGNNAEFLAVGSGVVRSEGGNRVPFSSSADGLELYCQIDAGFEPVAAVFGNIAYSIGWISRFVGSVRGLFRGEVVEYSHLFQHMRQVALKRLTDNAKAHGANAVVGIQTTIMPYKGAQEMLMIGTAARHAALGVGAGQNPVTSDLTCHEMWNLANMGYMPQELVLGVSVYSIGVLGRMRAWFQSWIRGEITDMTQLTYEARSNALARVKESAQKCGADQVAGIKTYVYDLGFGLMEFMAVGTAVRRNPAASTASAQLPAQAIICDQATFVNTVDTEAGTALNKGKKTKAEAEVKGIWDVVKLLLRLVG